LFAPYFNEESDVFIYSCSDDPNICQLSLHKDWDFLVFAWVRVDATYVFKFPKEALSGLGLSINHADGRMIERNALFKHSIRLDEQEMQGLCNYLIEIL
jgi:hypothetical protein